MTSAKRIFKFAGIYGIVALLPQYFLETKTGVDYPPAITHPEFFYGFIGVALAWQFGFLIIGRDPVRYRMMILPGIMEKVGFGLAALVLFFLGRTSPLTAIAGGLDLLWAASFAWAYFQLHL